MYWKFLKLGFAFVRLSQDTKESGWTKVFQKFSEKWISLRLLRLSELLHSVLWVSCLTLKGKFHWDLVSTYGYRVTPTVEVIKMIFTTTITNSWKKVMTLAMWMSLWHSLVFQVAIWLPNSCSGYKKFKKLKKMYKSNLNWN